MKRTMEYHVLRLGVYFWTLWPALSNGGFPADRACVRIPLTFHSVQDIHSRSRQNKNCSLVWSCLVPSLTFSSKLASVIIAYLIYELLVCFWVWSLPHWLLPHWPLPHWSSSSNRLGLICVKQVGLVCISFCLKYSTRFDWMYL